MIGTRRQIELTHCRPHQALTFRLEAAKLPDLPDAHIRVADNIGTLGIGIRESGVYFSGDLHSFTNRFTGFADFITAEFFIVHSWDFDVNFDAVENGT